VLRGCADQILGNASQIASGESTAEHVHQLRIGLRRLRSAGALFETPDAALMDGAATLFRQLGAARDAAVVVHEFGAAIETALRRAGLEAPSTDTNAPSSNAPADTVRAIAAQAWLLDLLGAMQPDDATTDVAPPPLRPMLAARLDRWHRQIVGAAARYADLDDAERHRLRKRAKRLRYASEFCAPLFGRRAVRRYLKALQAVQERLGAVSDAVMAADSFSGRASVDPQAMFALGWLSARREALVAAALPDLKAFAKAERFWTKALKQRD
jgi:CHAD domain-containing protein